MTFLRSLLKSTLSVQRVRLYSSASAEVKKTVLYDFHVSKGGKMVPFAGYLMPVQYSNLGIPQSHNHTRESCSIFDVSHMLQSEIWGKDRIEFMESLVVGDIGQLKLGSGTLTLFTTSSGGIIDDLIVSNTAEDHLYVVSNAGCRDKDIPLMQAKEKEFKSKGKDVSFKMRDDMALLAVQGPSSKEVLKPLVDIDLTKLYFMNTTTVKVAGINNCRITRCGYTGEDGVEISVPAEHAQKLTEALLSSSISKVELAGLGARDSLRLEAGLCLYGSDMDESTTPSEAALTWLLGKSRKQRKDFPGADRILAELADKSLVKRKRVGIICKTGPPPRAHMPILDSNSKKIGEITSGCPSPSLGYNVAMGYVDSSAQGVGTQVQIQVRNKLVPGEISKMPFLKGKYFTEAKK